MPHVTGPAPSRPGAPATASVRFYDRLHSGDVAPADLALDADHHPGRSRLDIGADLKRLGIKAKRSASRR
jgi:hypothetical protein